MDVWYSLPLGTRRTQCRQEDVRDFFHSLGFRPIDYDPFRREIFQYTRKSDLNDIYIRVGETSSNGRPTVCGWRYLATLGEDRGSPLRLSSAIERPMFLPRATRAEPIQWRD